MQITKAMANEWAQYGINVNAIGPRDYETEMTAPLFADEKRRAELLCTNPAEKVRITVRPGRSRSIPGFRSIGLCDRTGVICRRRIPLLLIHTLQQIIV